MASTLDNPERWGFVQQEIDPETELVKDTIGTQEERKLATKYFGLSTVLIPAVFALPRHGSCFQRISIEAQEFLNHVLFTAGLHFWKAEGVLLENSWRHAETWDFCMTTTSFNRFLARHTSHMIVPEMIDLCQ